MCQMCDEYEAELIRMGLIAEAQKVRTERHGAKRSEAVGPSPLVGEGARRADEGSGNQHHVPQDPLSK